MPATSLNPDGTVLEYSPTVRAERRGRPEEDGSYAWVVYTLAPVVGGVHPVHGEPTTLESVWVIAGQGTQAEADALATSLAAAAA